MKDDNQNGTAETQSKELDAIERVEKVLGEILNNLHIMFPTKSATSETSEGVSLEETTDLTDASFSLQVSLGGAIDVGHNLTIDRNAFEAVRDHPTNDGTCFLHSKSGHLYELPMTRSAALEILGKEPATEPKADPDQDIASDDSAVAPAEVSS